LVKAGALVRYSPLGTVKPTVQTYVLRLACTNGLTTNDIIKEFTFTGDGGRIWPWLRQSSRAAYNALGKVVERFQAMRAQQISPGDRASILALLLRRGQIHGAAAEVIRAEALAHPPETSYDMMNLIGWASSHIITDAKTVARVHDSMTDFVAQAEHARLCPACHRLI